MKKEKDGKQIVFTQPANTTSPIQTTPKPSNPKNKILLIIFACIFVVIAAIWGTHAILEASHARARANAIEEAIAPIMSPYNLEFKVDRFDNVICEDYEHLSDRVKYEILKSICEIYSVPNPVKGEDSISLSGTSIYLSDLSNNGTYYYYVNGGLAYLSYDGISGLYRCTSNRRTCVYEGP